MYIAHTKLRQIIQEEVDAELGSRERRRERMARLREKIRSIWNDQRFQSTLDAIAALGQTGVLGVGGQRAAVAASLASIGYEMGVARDGDRDADITHTVTEVAVLLSSLGLASSVPGLQSHIDELTGGAAIASLVDIVSNIGKRETLERAVCANATEPMARVLQAIIDDVNTPNEARAVAQSQLEALGSVELTEEECESLRQRVASTS